MKRIAFLVTLLAAFAAVCCHRTANQTSHAAKVMAILKDPSSNKVLVAAHRGDWRNHPENSIPGIESLIAMGADIMELDVKMTSDGVLVISHDHTVDRTTDGSGPVSSFTLDSLKRLRLKTHEGKLTDIGMPTLEEALQVCKDRILVNVDQGWDFLPEVLEVARKVGTVDQLIFKAGGTRNSLSAMAKTCADAGLYFMPILSISAEGDSPSADSFLDGGEMPGLFEICFSADSPKTEKYIKDLQAGGSKVWVNSIWGSLCGDLDDDRAFKGQAEADATYGKLIGLGFKVFQSDRPEYLLNYLRNKGLHD